MNDTSFLTALGNLAEAGSGTSGSNGYPGQDGEHGLDKEIYILTTDKLKNFF